MKEKENRRHFFKIFSTATIGAIISPFIFSKARIGSEKLGLKVKINTEAVKRESKRD